MSIFPAYCVKTDEDKSPDPRSTSDTLNWLSNNSYTQAASNVPSVETIHPCDAAIEKHCSDSKNKVKRSHESSCTSGDDDGEASLKSRRSHHDHHHGHHRNRHRHAHKQEKKTKHNEVRKPELTAESRLAKPTELQVRLSETLTKILVPPSGKVFLHELPDLRTRHAFRIDRNRDDNNFACGSVYRTHIARYHKQFNAKNDCLGFSVCSSDMKAISADRYFALAGKCHGKSSSVDFQQSLKTSKIQRISVSQTSAAAAFIPLSADSGESSSANFMCSSESDKINARNDQLDESDSKTSSHSKLAECNKKVCDDPGNIGLWIELVDCQSLCIRNDSLLEGLSPDRVSTAVTEIKAAVLERALEKNPSSIELKLFQLEVCETLWDSDKKAGEWKKLVFTHASNPFVWRRYLRRSRSVFQSFTTSNITSAFIRALSTLRGARDGTLLSHQALPHTTDHMIGLFHELCLLLCGTGHREKAVALYQAQIEFNLFRPAVLGSSTTHADAVDFMSVYWDSSAPKFGEESFCGWGAWVETGGDHRSGVQWYSKDMDEATEQSIIAEHEHSNRSLTWIAMESSRHSRHWLPWRPDFASGEMSAEDCEDPERVVVFDDISKELFTVESDHHRFQLVIGFLRLLSPLVGTANVGFWSSYMDILMEIWGLSGPDEEIEMLCSTSEVLKNVDCKTAFSEACCSECKFEKMLQFIENIFQQSLGLFTGTLKTLFTVRYLNFKIVVYNNQRTTQSKQEMKSSVKELRKLFKSLLKLDCNRGELSLWERFATFEWETGNVDEARRIFETAISMIGSEYASSASNACQKYYIVHLFRTYASLELGVGSVDGVDLQFGRRVDTDSCQANFKRTLNILMTLVEKSHASSAAVNSPEVTPSAVLRAKHLYQRHYDELLAQFLAIHTQPYDGVPFIGCLLLDWTVCFAMFQYVTVGLPPATSIIQAFLSSVRIPEAHDSNYCSQKSPEFIGSIGGNAHALGNSAAFSLEQYAAILHRQCTDMYVSLLCFHMKTRAVSLEVVRKPLMEALHVFPEDGRLLQLLIDIESSGFVIHRLRSYFHQATNSASSCLPFLYAILAERRRMLRLSACTQTDCHLISLSQSANTTIETGVTHQIRSWFEKAVNHESAKRSALVWRLYMLFEAELKSPQRVKTVFYRSVQCCPWAKVLYLDCIRLVPEMLQEVTDLMTEKEIRLRTPLEELDLLILASRPLNEVAL